MRYLLAIILPPIAVLACGRPFVAILNFILTLCLWVPGAVHALFIVHDYKADQRTSRMMRTRVVTA